MGKSTIITRYTYLKMDMIGVDPLYLFYLDVRVWNHKWFSQAYWACPQLQSMRVISHFRKDGKCRKHGFPN